MDNPTTSRDGRGRFARGNPGGPGRRRGFREDLLQAADEAVNPEHLGAVMRRAVRMALEGNLSAIRFVVERTCGRAREAAIGGEPVDLSLPRMTTAADCDAAIERLTQGVCDGSVDRDTARVLADLIRARVATIELRELEARIEGLENSARTSQALQERRN